MKTVVSELNLAHRKSFVRTAPIPRASPATAPTATKDMAHDGDNRTTAPEANTSNIEEKTGKEFHRIRYEFNSFSKCPSSGGMI
jgi:hypothetical protein